MPGATSAPESALEASELSAEPAPPGTETAALTHQVDPPGAFGPATDAQHEAKTVAAVPETAQAILDEELSDAVTDIASAAAFVDGLTGPTGAEGGSTAATPEQGIFAHNSLYSAFLLLEHKSWSQAAADAFVVP